MQPFDISRYGKATQSDIIAAHDPETHGHADTDRYAAGQRVLDRMIALEQAQSPAEYALALASGPFAVQYGRTERKR